MIKILATDGLDKSAVKTLEEMGNKVDIQSYPVEELKTVLKDYDVLIVRSATKVRVPLIDAIAGSNLKLMIRAGVGIDNIDYEYAESKGIKVMNTPNSSSASVAELVIAHMFSLARFIYIANVTMRKGEWNKNKYTGIELNGKTLGLIGLGKIGSLVAAKAAALGMHVIYNEILGELQGYPYTYVTLDDLLSKSDFISIHVPATEKPIIDESKFEIMKKGAYLINTSRATAISEAGLLKALGDGTLSGAALDVFSEEPLKNQDILNNPKISLTPHIGASTKEAQERIGSEVVEVIKNFFKL
ncbi:MAG: D-2-hydroxyacid dehydrogenase [Oscillospiraceae bacterium]|nr:D-2-hydroxyacid dehydrogenase [Oscillospiraceae bacterium]